MLAEAVLGSILATVDYADEPLIAHDYHVEFWPEGAADRLTEMGILRPAKPAQYLPCRECSEQPIEEVVYLTDRATGRPTPYLSCYACGPVEVPPERLKRWTVDLDSLLEAIFAGAGLTGSRSEIVPGRVWRVGRTHWNETKRTVYFARGLHRRDAWGTLQQAHLSPKSVVFGGAKAAASGPPGKTSPVIVPLCDAVSWTGSAMRFDQEFVESCLAADSPSSANGKAKPRKRGPRTANIEALARELEEHVRAARDFALETRDRTGTPQLLPRPSMDELARRIGAHKATVSRCLDDPEAGKLKYLWDLAADLDRILGIGSR